MMSTPSHRSSPLDLDPDEFRKAGHALVDRIADLLRELPARPVTPAELPDEVRSAIDAEAALPETGEPLGPLLESAAEVLIAHSLFNGHPRFLGYVTSSPAPVGMLGDLLAAAINPNVGAWRLSPVASEIEAQTVRWIAELIRCPPEFGGLLVSGGNMANMVGFLAARASIDPRVRTRGAAREGDRPLRVYASSETHTWIHKAADISGIGTESIRWIPTDGDLRMDVSALRGAIDRDVAEGGVPMLVAGTAGSVSTGAVDPLFEIAELCRERKIWFHVDGAYGAFAAAVDGAPEDLRALSRADSIALDPHKWLYAPLEAGCVLVRDVERLRAAFSYHPPYYHFGQGSVDYVDLGPQNSRGFRALKVWLALRQVGRRGYARMIGDDMRLARRLRERVEDHPALEPIASGLSICAFRYVPEGLREGRGEEEREKRLNALNEALLERVQRSGALFLSNAVVRGRYALRACIVNFRTDEGDVDAIPGLVVGMGREVWEEMQRKAIGIDRVAGDLHPD